MRKKIMPVLLAVSLLSAFILSGCSSVSDEAAGLAQGLAETEKGLVQGENLEGVVRFLGIPYAQSIAGRNRFAPPQPVEAWTGIRDALRYADSAPQVTIDPTGGTPVTPAFDPPSYVETGDDCLALNVWTPENASGDLPVMVWLHGGGWTTGSGSCAVYDGENLARRGDVIVVTINHRLGASGLADFSRIIGGDFAESSNLAIRDITAALQWVHNNISAFGGNPDLVTIFGESGGGWKVNTMLGTPAAEGLFHRAVVQSGPLTRFQTPEEADKLAGALLEELGITPETAEKLYEISGEELVAAETRVSTNPDLASGMATPGFPSGFWPVIDGEIITDHVWDNSPAQRSLNVPLMVGQNGTEFTLFMLQDQAAYNLDEESLNQRVAGMFGEDLGSMILGTYSSDFPGAGPSELWFRIFSDFAMGALSSEILDVSSAGGNAPVYGFRFDWQTPIYDGKLYSPHTIEIPFVFNNVSTEAGIVMTGGGAEAVALGEQVSSAWVEFAKTGRPSAAGLPQWPEYTTDSPSAMHLNTESTVAPYMNRSIKELFHNMLWTMAGLKN